MPQPWAWPPCCPPRKLLSYVNGALLPPSPPQHLIPCAAPKLDLRRGCGVSGTLSQRQEKVAGRRKDHKAGDKRSVPQGPYPGANSLREGPPLRSTCRVGFLRTSERCRAHATHLSRTAPRHGCYWQDPERQGWAVPRRGPPLAFWALARGWGGLLVLGGAPGKLGLEGLALHTPSPLRALLPGSKPGVP